MEGGCCRQWTMENESGSMREISDLCCSFETAARKDLTTAQAARHGPLSRRRRRGSNLEIAS